MLSKKKIGQSFLLLAIVLGGFLLAKNAFALDTGINAVGNTIQLGAADPRTIVARVINVAMMFLGIIAVAIIIFAGFKWMTSQGNEEQIESAKKILKGGIIGLVIVLASWGIAAFILNRLLGATGSNNGGGGNGADNGGTLPSCSGIGCQGMTCDDQPLDNICQFSTSSCQTSLGLFCSPSTCTCQPCSGSSCNTNSGGSFGDACNKNLITDSNPNPVCDADNNKCDTSQGLTCDAGTCTCLGSPVITNISPVGGFCAGDKNKACNNDGDCATVVGGGACNTLAPNGAVNNIISVHGYNFGTSTSGSQVIFLGDVASTSDDQIAIDPSTINSFCTDNWTNNEIIIAVPANAAEGPIKVINGGLNSNLTDFDTTDNDIGSKIPSFVPNTIVRPGICRITPDAGVLGSSVRYFGNNLNGAGYFGNESNKFKGVSSTFVDDKTSGQVLVPNVAAGSMSTFVVNTVNQKSNYVAFRKDQEPPVPPSISSFEPEVGSVGQYITIRGNGFGNSRGTNQVFLENTEAGYNFPDICLHSVWKDNQVIVKVPAGLADGGYKIKMKINPWPDIVSALNFNASSTEPLSPSLCKIEPERGPVDSRVSFYGEYFSSSTPRLATARFYNTKDSSGTVADDRVSAANRLEAIVPIGSVTGPVKIVDNARIGNSLNFVVGSCTKNSECGSSAPVCCPFGSPKQGQCASALIGSQNGCYNNALTSVFEWKFGTALAVPCDSNLNNAVCDASDSMCASSNLRCNPTSCTCEACPDDQPNCGQTVYSCAQNNACSVGFCPNSPGQCSPYAGGNSEVTGACQQTCSNVLGCMDLVGSSSNGLGGLGGSNNGRTPITGRGLCTYDSNLNKCIKNNFTCDNPKIDHYSLGSVSRSATKSCVDGNWVMTTNSSCPTGWTNIGGGKCRSTEACSNCPDNFVCNSNNKCVNKTVVCPTGSVCEGTQCIKKDLASCNCCCEIGQDSRDCCSGTINGASYQLTCAGTCGSDTNPNDNSGYGKCSGCSNVGSTSEDHDAACNCSGTNGKYCKDDVCTDCSDLSQGDCTGHASSCCWDDKDGVCRGGSGKAVTTDTESVNYGHCAFYACVDNTANVCSSTPSIYSTSTADITANYVYKDNQCLGCTARPLDPNTSCSSALTLTSCQGKAGCCWNAKNLANKCIAGGQINNGYCAYYDCQAASNSDQCATSTPSFNGTYPSLAACAAGCRIPHLGAACNTTATTTRASVQTCNVSTCSGLFSCLTENPFSVVSSSTPATSAGGCGICCCQPGELDTCGSINRALTCKPNKGNCTGQQRGLCCGCQNDTYCGNTAVLGCSSDSCCQERPSVAATRPFSNEENVCRNSVISVTFNKKMDVASLVNNFVLLSESDSTSCPAGTSHLALGRENNPLNFLARIYNKIISSFQRTVNSIARIISPNSAMAYAISDSKTYCVASGVTAYENTATTTILKFTPSSALQADTDYIAVVKGQDNLDSLASSTALGKAGVLSSDKIGMAGSGLANRDAITSPTIIGPRTGLGRLIDEQIRNPLTPAFGPFGTSDLYFNNSYSWHFKTLNDNSAVSGMCLVDSVDLTPPAYIFQKNTSDDINENDASSADLSFDTVADRDKLYVAKALSSNGQELQPVTSYSWTWNWNISDTTKVNFTTGTDLPDNGSRRLLNVQTGITDARVTVTAATSMLSDNAYSTISHSKTVPASVFVCLNPWPPVNNNYSWEPSRDLAGLTYGNYSYEFYYCRDSGDPSTTADDLPAISSGSDIINLGISNRKVCSNNRNIECTANANACAASGGFCIPDILKESYFFQQ